MTRTTVARIIDAPVDRVFQAVADISNFSKAVPHIINVEFISDVRTGKGARFKETRMINGREATTELEVTEYVENERVRFVSDTGGTIWDTIFTVSPREGSTELAMTMDAKPHRFLAKIMTPMIKGVVQKAIEKDMDAVKVYCESGEVMTHDS